MRKEEEEGTVQLKRKRRKTMTFTDGDQINFEQMEKELKNMIDDDVKYWEENDAKFRAVDQRVATYDEFRDIVKASHLKPIDKKSLEIRPKKIWNVFANKNARHPFSRSTSLQSVLQPKKNSTTPSTYHDFTQQWRKEYTTDIQRLEFLKMLGIEKLRLLLREELTFGILGEMLRALLKHSNSIEDITFTVRLLEIITLTKRFTLALQFLNSTEKEDCQLLFSVLQKDLQNNQQDLAEKEITEWAIRELSKKFHVEVKH